MRYKNINDLIEYDSEAKSYFNSLSGNLQSSVKAHGDGINTLEELKNFVDVFNTQGGRS